MHRPSTHPDAPERMLHALHAATWFALCEGDRYAAMGRKAVANSFYRLLPMLAEVRQAMLADRDTDAGGAALPPAQNDDAG